MAVLRRHPGITIVDGGRDNDDIATAIRKAGRVGQVTVVGMDSIGPILEAVREGVLEYSAATIPVMQGSMAILMLWQASLGVPMPQRIDTGIDLITSANVGAFLAAAERALPRTNPTS